MLKLSAPESYQPQAKPSGFYRINDGGRFTVFDGFGNVIANDVRDAKTARLLANVDEVHRFLSDYLASRPGEGYRRYISEESLTARAKELFVRVLCCRPAGTR